MSTIFEQIIAGEIPCKKVFENDRILAIHDINPIAPVHILIMPKKHFPNISSVGKEDGALIAEIFDVAKQLAEEHKISGGYRIITNNGPLAGQTVFHLHFHLLGGKPLKWIA